MKVLLLVFGGLVVWGAVTGKTGAGGPPTAATEIPTHGGHGSTLVGLLVAAGLVALLVKAGGGHGRSVRAAACSHGNRSRGKVVKHERAHQRALRLAGCGGSSLRVKRGSNGLWEGVVRPHSKSRWKRLDPAGQIAVYRAGGAAAPGTNTDHDDANAAAILAAVRRRDRARVDREADLLVRKWRR